MEFVIKIKHKDGSGGNLIFTEDRKDEAIQTFDKLEVKYKDTETEVSKTTVITK